MSDLPAGEESGRCLDEFKSSSTGEPSGKLSAPQVEGKPAESTLRVSIQRNQEDP